MSLDPIEKILEKGREVTLNKEKKDAMHQELLMFMEKHPMQEKPKKSWTGFQLLYGIFKVRVIAFASVMVVMVGGITTVTASSALPGSFLYPVKVGINEKVEEVLAFSDEAKLELSIALTDRRLQEIEQLAVEEKIDSENEAELRKNFNAQSKKASEHLDRLNKKGDKKAGEMSTRFEASLRAHHVILNGLKKEKSNESPSIANDILDAAAQISDMNTGANDSEDSLAMEKTSSNQGQGQKVEEKIASIEKSVQATKKLIEDKSFKIGSEAVSQSKENLLLIEEKIEEARKFKEKNDYKSALSSLHDASVIAQESKDLIHGAIRLGIKVPIRIRPHYKKRNEVRQINQQIKVTPVEKIETQGIILPQDLPR